MKIPEDLTTEIIKRNTGRELKLYFRDSKKCVRVNEEPFFSLGPLQLEEMMTGTVNACMQCVAELEPYRVFAPEIEQALKDLENLVKDLNKENREKATRIVTGFHQGASPYASYIPVTVSNLQFLKEWLEKKK